MASTDAKPWPVKNEALRVTFPIFKNDGTLITGATGLDSEVSKDGAAFADCTNEATEIGSTGIYYLDLTSTEMNADTVAVQVKTTSTGAVPPVLVMYPVSIIEPTGPPTWPMDIEELLGWLGALSRNKRTQTATTQTLRNDADSGTISTSTVSDDGTTYTAGEWS